MNIVNFNAAVLERHTSKRCNCWECLRDVGLTPPRSMRTKHPSLHPYTLFEDDLMGDPIANRKKKEDQIDNPDEAHHLREAVKNRSVI